MVIVIEKEKGRSWVNELIKVKAVAPPTAASVSA